MSFMDTARKRAQMVKEWKVYADKIAEAVRRVLPDAQVFVFGSVVRGDYIASSDVDILVISSKIPEGLFERGRIKAEIEKEAGLPYYHPFELHMVRPEEAEPYLRRIRNYMVRI